MNIKVVQLAILDIIFEPVGMKWSLVQQRIMISDHLTDEFYSQAGLEFSF